MPVRYITAATAAALDARLFSLYPLPQLMELAGAAVAFAAAKTFPLPAHRTVVVVCGPGNNGGDGLVAARHLHAFGYAPTVVVPRVGEGHCAALLSQLRALDVPCVPSLGAADFSCFSFVVDAVFGFSFRGPQVKEPYASLLAAMAAPGAPPVFSVDVPSGWAVDAAEAPPREGGGVRPAALISLTVPKAAAAAFEALGGGGAHWLGLRGVVPPGLAQELALPEEQLWAAAGADPAVRLR